MFPKIERLPEFDRDMKQLLKRFRTLEEDLTTFVKTAVVGYHVHRQQSIGIVRIERLGFEEPALYKARRFACKSLKGKGSNTGLRIIYAYFAEESRVVLTEIYYKGDKENEDRRRIQQHFGA